MDKAAAIELARAVGGIERGVTWLHAVKRLPVSQDVLDRIHAAERSTQAALDSIARFRSGRDGTTASLPLQP